MNLILKPHNSLRMKNSPMSFFKKVKQYMTGRYTSDYTYRTEIWSEGIYAPKLFMKIQALLRNRKRLH